MISHPIGMIGVTDNFKPSVKRTCEIDIFVTHLVSDHPGQWLFGNVLDESKPLPIRCRSHEVVSFWFESPEVTRQRGRVKRCQQDRHRQIASRAAESPFANGIHGGDDLNVTRGNMLRARAQTEYEDREEPTSATKSR